jgi:hypothetical protein
MTRSKAIDYALWITILLLLLFGGSSIWRQTAPARQARATPPPIVRPAASSKETDATAEEAHSARTETVAEEKVHKTECNLRVRVMPGESVVMGYHEIAPGRLGASLVTPEALPDGLVSLKVMVVEVTDTPEMRQKAHDLFPHIFELEKTGVISAARKTELLRDLLRDEAVKTISYPTMATAPNTACQIRNVVDRPGKESLGMTYALQANAIPGSEGFDLSLDFQHTGIREEE